MNNVEDAVMIDEKQTKLIGWLERVATSSRRFLNPYSWQIDTHEIPCELVDEIRQYMGMPRIDRTPKWKPSGGE